MTARAEAKKHVTDSVAAGRVYVEAYVEYVHFVARLVEQGAPRRPREAVAESGE